MLIQLALVLASVLPGVDHGLLVNAVGPRTEAATLSVIVVDASSDQPLQGALARLDGGHERISDAAGRVSWEGLSDGTYRLTVEHLGYETLRRELSHSAAETGSPIRVRLRPRPVLLDELEVLGRRPLGSVRERFEARRRIGRGDFILPEVFEERSHQSLGRVIAQNSGLQRECLDGVCRLVSRRATAGFGQCGIQYYLNGVHLPMPDRPDIDGMVPTSMVRAVEVYRGPSQIPPEYNRFDGACGVVLIWTHDGP